MLGTYVSLSRAFGCRMPTLSCRWRDGGHLVVVILVVGVIVLTVLALVVPYALWAGLVATGMDSNEVGVVLSGVFVIGSILLWTFSYIFRVFTKNMTYSTQLKQYEDAVIAKRFEELQDDEVEALLGEIEREEAI